MPLPDAVAARVAGDDRAIVVTGATGWFGRVTLELLAEVLDRDEFERRVVAFASRPRQIELSDGCAVAVGALDELPTNAPPGSVIFHYAYLTRDRVSELGVDRYVRTSLELSATVLRTVLERSPSGLFFASSGAVYGHGGAGALDVAANAYGTLKLLDELALRQACRDAGTRCLVARVFATAGRFMTKRSLYALGDLVDQVLAGGAVEVKARHPVRRSYVGADDLVAVAVAHLFAPPGEEAQVEVFDAGGDVVEVGELATRVARALGRPEAPVLRSLDPDAPADVYVGDRQVMDELAEHYGVRLTPLDDLIRQVAAGEGAAPS